MRRENELNIASCTLNRMNLALLKLDHANKYMKNENKEDNMIFSNKLLGDDFNTKLKRFYEADRFSDKNNK